MSQDTSPKRPKVKHHVANDQAFQIIPEWVLMADISAQAIRLYLVLRKFGDNTTEESYWSRENIAAGMKLKSPRSVDTYVKELVSIGALEVAPRFDGQRQTSNLYRVITADPSQYAKREGAESCTPVGAESCSRTQNQHDLRTKVFHGDSAESPDGATTADAAATIPSLPGKHPNHPVRKAMREAIIRTAHEGNHGEAHEALASLAGEYHGQEFADFVQLKCTFDKPARDPFEAGKKLNTVYATAETMGVVIENPIHRETK